MQRIGQRRARWYRTLRMYVCMYVCTTYVTICTSSSHHVCTVLYCTVLYCMYRMYRMYRLYIGLFGGGKTPSYTPSPLLTTTTTTTTTTANTTTTTTTTTTTNTILLLLYCYYFTATDYDHDIHSSISTIHHHALWEYSRCPPTPNHSLLSSPITATTTTSIPSRSNQHHRSTTQYTARAASHERLVDSSGKAAYLQLTRQGCLRVFSNG